MPQTLEIVKISKKHLPFCNIIAKTAPDPWTPQDIAAELSQQNHSGFVALSNQTVAGFAFFLDNGSNIDLLQMVVSEQFRRMGVGFSFLEYCLGFFSNQQAKTCTLEVRAGNIAAISLYQKLGFVALATRKNLYGNPPENGLLMQKQL